VSLPGTADQDLLKSQSSARCEASASRKEESSIVKEEAKGSKRDLVHKSEREPRRDLSGKKMRRRDPKGLVEKFVRPFMRALNSNEH
jgi:hypothetical protein